MGFGLSFHTLDAPFGAAIIPKYKKWHKIVILHLRDVIIKSNYRFSRSGNSFMKSL